MMGGHEMPRTRILRHRASFGFDIQVIALGLVITLLGCAKFGSAFFDVKPKAQYTLNKLILITALIEDHKRVAGQYPGSLEEIRASLAEFIQTNPKLADTYICSPWTSTKIDLFSGATGNPYWYVLDTETGKYFLYTSYGDFAKTPLDLAFLRGIRDARQKVRRSSLYLVYGGDLVWGPCPLIHGINLGNMADHMRPVDYRGHTIAF
jgi:hypothetical protein